MFPMHTSEHPVNPSLYGNSFLLVPDETIKRTYDATITGYIYQTHCAPFPALSVKRRNKPVANNAIYSDIAAIDSGSDSAQINVGCKQSIVRSTA